MDGDRGGIVSDRAEDHPIRRTLSRRSALAALGIGTAAASTVLVACDSGCPNAGSGGSGAEELNTTADPKPASDATKAANQKLLDTLPFDNTTDFDDAGRDLIDRPDTLTIKNANGDVIWDLEEYKTYIKPGSASPDTVNPSLWRNAQLCMNYGLFRVADRIFQVRGYDLSNITFIQGDTGWIVFDPLISPETASAAYDLVTKNLGNRPIVAVVHSHSHVDHYGGVRGIVNQADVDAGKVKIIAPEGFVEHSVSENVIAGNVMSVARSTCTGRSCRAIRRAVSTADSDRRHPPGNRA